ncbi:cysteine desulfurase family protein [Sulfuriroseicoccus oceanibius]|uniref:cysteine desulfurase n=1 Tax=Sulfuriroseicoccus oceanibius TaxID=2707525 RepID=A0A6B3L5F5_9BACT|nr:aminotransferase class V-fold PLP-dependent enzyme [Sulfuriroseicoccus oceanibius]QQL44925.1 aminotransferase class V-fold PLP-dependent enzyme [Sulfuriroseicoccus oceanibius]
MIYLDNNATTPLLPEVVDAMLPFLTKHYANPSVAYDFAAPVREAMEKAHVQVAELINASPEEIIFTGCGTEADNSAIASALALQPSRKKVVVGATEHSAIGKAAAHIAGKQNVLVIPVQRDGRLDLEVLRSTLENHAPEIALVSIMWANNETGVIHPVEEIAALTQAAGIPFHTDAIQAAGKVPIDVAALPVTYLSLAAHKFHGPKGVGALYVRTGARFRNQLVGGGQEAGRRAGTENVAGIVAMGAAAEAMRYRIADGVMHRVELLRNHFENLVVDGLDSVTINGSPEHRVPNTSNLCISGARAEAMLMLLDEAGLCCSSGSACKTGSSAPSAVLTAMGIPARDARTSLRFSLSSLTTAVEVESAAKLVIDAAVRVRRESPQGGVVIHS